MWLMGKRKREEVGVIERKLKLYISFLETAKAQKWMYPYYKLTFDGPCPKDHSNGNGRTWNQIRK